jgi:signal transduction histidine kinase/DNA-binding response OmpR family regulator
MPVLLTKSYLRQRFWLAGLTIGISIILSLAAGGYMLSSFQQHGHYSKLFTDLMQATSRFESEMSSPASKDDAAVAHERLSEAHREIVALYGLMRHLDGVQEDAVKSDWLAIEKGFRLYPQEMMERYGLENGSMPNQLKEVWEAVDISGKSLEAGTSELVTFGQKILAVRDRTSAQYQARANYLRNHIHDRMWPFFHTALDAIGRSTADSSQLGFYLLSASAGAVFLTVIFNALFIFMPMAGSILKTQRELVQERDRAIESDRAKRDFLALMSHELRTPMNGVLGFTNMLLSSHLTAKQKDYAETIQSSGLTLLDLLNDILDISNFESGALELETSNFSLEEVVAEVVSLLGPQAFAKRLDISAYVDPSLPEKMAGAVGRLRQILLKLASNAIKFTERGGIAIEVRAGEARTDGAHNVNFSVTDTGIGIPADHLVRIFDHFTQVDSSSRRKYGGAGLGLPICKQLVELMHGKISIESNLDQGSTFSFNIRLADIAPPGVKIRESFNVDLRRRRCLVVDDHALNRRIVRLQLEGFGAEVDGAPDSQTAMASLAEAHRNGRPYHIAIVDHMMPGIDGLTLRRLIREQPQYAGLKLIISSSGGITFDQQARALGFDAACPKPVMQEKLVRQVYELLQQPVAPPSHAPLVLLEPVVVAAAPPPEEDKSRKHRLLVAEDNPINQRLIGTALKQAGYIVDMVGDGVEAVHAVQRLPYDLVLMDIRMPVMSGVEATQRIRSMSGPAASLPIIAMTANTMVGDREEYLDSGMNDYVAKPIDFHLLMRKITNYLSDVKTDAVAPDETPARKAPGGAKLA